VAAPDFVIKAHDQLPAIAATLVDADLVPVDISDATVLFIMANATSRVVKLTSEATVVDGVAGRVEYQWNDTTDTATPGEYVAEWQVTFGDGKKQTFPSNSYNTVSIVADLDNA
jgi:hypothetical protein